MQTLQTALRNDGSKPALCHTVAWDGALNENITLELNHPRTPCVPTLYVGNTYVRRNNYGGCIYRPNDDGMTGRVRRATLREVPNGEFVLYFLCEPDGGSHQHLVHVVLEPPANVMVKKRFYANVQTNGHMAIGNENEFLLELKADKYADALLADGRVVRVVCNGTVVVEKLPIEQQAQIRIAMTKELLKGASTLNGNLRVKSEDYALHQMISIIEAVAKHSEMIRVSLSRDLRTIEKQMGGFRPNVSERLEKVMWKLQSNGTKKAGRTHENESAFEAAMKAAETKKNGTK